MPSIEHKKSIVIAQRASVVDLSRDSDLIAIAQDETVVVVDISTGQPLATWSCAATVSDISIAADGTQVAVATKHPTIEVYEVANGAVVSRLDRAGGPDFVRDDPQEHVVIYPNGNKVVSTGARRRVYVSDVESGKWDYIMFVKHGSSFDCAVSPDGDYVAMFGEPNRDEMSGQVTMYRVNHGLQPLWTNWHEGDLRVHCAVFSHDSKRLATCGASDGIRVWDVETGLLSQHLKPAIEPISVAFCSSEHIASTSESQIELLQIETGKSVAIEEIGKQVGGSSSSADGLILATYGSDAAVDIWSVKLAPTIGSK